MGLVVPERLSRRSDAATLSQVQSWAQDLDEVMECIGPRFARPEPRQRARAYLHGLLSPVERKNSWQLAEQAGDASPHGVQHLLGRATWDADQVRDDWRAYVTEHIGHPQGIWILDETGFLKKGKHSAGVQRQYSGTAGRIENCQIGVFLAYASPRGRAFVDRALYLPQSWAQNWKRRKAAGVPKAIRFATKPTLARPMLERAFAAGMPGAWVTGDTVYGNDGKLRAYLEQERKGYVLAVACTHQVALPTGVKRGAAALVKRREAAHWQRRSAGDGAKGPRLYDGTRLELASAIEGWQHWLLVRRSVSKPGERAYYRVFAPAGTSLEEMVRVAGARWSIEECIEAAKGEVGLDHYEVRSWTGWYRHITLALLAHAYLTVVRARAVRAGEAETAKKKSACGRPLARSANGRPCCR